MIIVPRAILAAAHVAHGTIIMPDPAKRPCLVRQRCTMPISTAFGMQLSIQHSHTASSAVAQTAGTSSLMLQTLCAACWLSKSFRQVAC